MRGHIPWLTILGTRFHVYFDNLVNPDILQQAANEFPSPEQFDFYKYDNPLEKKLAFDQISKLPPTVQQVLIEMNSPYFLNFLEVLTGIEGLIPDPYYRGGGIHQILPGGKLDIHVDFNIHPKLKLHRRLNVLIYLNEDWKEEYGGHFEIWSGYQEERTHVLEECHARILPIFNRLALFTTAETSYHGHPDPLTCPAGRTRRSLATYYYTALPEETLEPHSTVFIKRPHDEESPELADLRERRNQGRLKSIVRVDHEKPSL